MSKNIKCSSCGQGKPADAFSKNQQRQKTPKCKSCVDGGKDAQGGPGGAKEKDPSAPVGKGPGANEAPQAKAQQPAKGEEGLVCSACGKSVPKKNYTANQLSKKDDRKCKDCTGQQGGAPAPSAAPAGSKGGKGGKGGGKGQAEEKTFACADCGEDLPASEYSKSQLKKGPERRCQVCVEEEQMYGGEEFGENFERNAELVDMLLSLGPEKATKVLSEMVQRGQLGFEDMMQIQMMLRDFGEDGEDFDEDEDDEEDGDELDDEEDLDSEDLNDAEDDTLDHMGLEVIANLVHDFENEAAVLAKYSPTLKRSERLKIINEYLELKRARLVKLDKEYYSSAFGDARSSSKGSESESDELRERTSRQDIFSKFVKEAKIQADKLAWARGLVSPFARTNLFARDLVRLEMSRKDNFGAILLWAGGRRFDGCLRGEPELVKAASRNDLEAVSALLVAGGDIEACSSWFYKGYSYDNDTALTAACRQGHKDMVEFLLKAGASKKHTCFDKDAFFEAQKNKVAEPPKPKEPEKPKSEFSFEPPSEFSFSEPKKDEPEEETALSIAKKKGHADVIKILQ